MIRSRVLRLPTAQPGARRFDRRLRSRRAGLLVWILPALAAIVVASVWWGVPKSQDAESPEASRKSFRQNAEVRSQKAAAQTLANPLSGRPASGSASEGPSIPRGESIEGPLQHMTLTEIQQAVTGEWSGFYQGQRRLSVREGGQATMVVEPEGIASLMLAAKLTFDVQWTVRGDQLEFETMGGQPLEQVNVVVKMYGRRRSHKILSLQHEKIVLLDEDGVTQYIWNRITDDTKNAPAAVSD